MSLRHSTTTYAPPAAVSRAPSQQPCVLVRDIERGRYGDPSTWSFGTREENYVNLQKLVDDAWSSPLTQAQLMSIPDERARNEKWWAMKANILAINPKIYGARPSNDPSVSYTHIELAEAGPVWFTIRWWDGDEYRTYFDLVDVRDRTRVLRPPQDLKIEARYEGIVHRLLTLEEETRRARGVPSAPPNSEERYVAPPGALLKIYRQDLLIANVFVPVPNRGAGLWPETKSYSRR